MKYDNLPDCLALEVSRSAEEEWPLSFLENTAGSSYQVSIRCQVYKGDPQFQPWRKGNTTGYPLIQCGQCSHMKAKGQRQIRLSLLGLYGTGGKSVHTKPKHRRQRAGEQHSTVMAPASLEDNKQCWTSKKIPPVHRAGTTGYTTKFKDGGRQQTLWFGRIRPKDQDIPLTVKSARSPAQHWPAGNGPSNKPPQAPRTAVTCASQTNE